MSPRSSLERGEARTIRFRRSKARVADADRDTTASIQPGPASSAAERMTTLNRLVGNREINRRIAPMLGRGGAASNATCWAG